MVVRDMPSGIAPSEPAHLQPKKGGMANRPKTGRAHGRTVAEYVRAVTSDGSRVSSQGPVIYVIYMLISDSNPHFWFF